MSLLGYPIRSFPTPSLNTLGLVWNHSFSSYAQNIIVKNALIDSVTLTFQPQNHVTSRISQGHSIHQV